MKISSRLLCAALTLSLCGAGAFAESTPISTDSVAAQPKSSTRYVAVASAHAQVADTQVADTQVADTQVADTQVADKKFASLGLNERASVKAITYKGWAAFRLSDGKSEAIVGPEIGRVMSYGKVGGENWLYNATEVSKAPGAWRNWGGDKTWAAPQLYWGLVSGYWPQDPVWDTNAHSAKILAGGRLQMESSLSKLVGSRIVREFSFDRNGEFVIAQTVEKVKNDPIVISIWNVTQNNPAEAIFLPLDPESPYKDNIYKLAAPKPLTMVNAVTPTLMQSKYVVDFGYKVASRLTNVTIAAAMSKRRIPKSNCCRR